MKTLCIIFFTDLIMEKNGNLPVIKAKTLC